MHTFTVISNLHRTQLCREYEDTWYLAGMRRAKVTVHDICQTHVR